MKNSTALSPVLKKPQIWLCLCFVWLLVGCSVKESAAPDLPPVTETPGRTSTSTPIPSVTPTLTPTPRPTYTMTPSETPTPWPTGSGFDKLPDPNRKYRLIDWTPEKAEQLVQALYDYTSGLERNSPGLYRQVAFAEKEADLRFPELPFKYQNIWETYTIAKFSYLDVEQKAADLVMEILSHENLKLEELNTWLERFRYPDMRYAVDILPLPDYPGYQNSQIVIFKELYDTGNIDNYAVCAFWLLEKDGQYSAYPLAASFRYEGYSKLELMDLTGDGYPEAVLTVTDGRSQGFRSGSLDIFDLHQIPPQKMKLDFVPDGIDLSKTIPWKNGEMVLGAAIQIDQGPGELWPALCEYLITWNYRWTGKQFQLAEVVPPVLGVDTDQRCFDAMLIYDLYGKVGTRNPVILQALNQRIEYYSLSYSEEMINGLRYEIFPDRSSFRFEYGFVLAFWGKDDMAMTQMRAVANDPDKVNPELTEFALQYIQKNRGHTTLLDYCLETHICGKYFSFSTLISLIPVERFSETNELLEEMGVRMREYGKYDFNRDGIEENWMAFFDVYRNERFVITYLEGDKNRWISNWGFSPDVYLENLEIVGINPSPRSGVFAYRLTSETIKDLNKEFLFPPQSDWPDTGLADIAAAAGVEAIPLESPVAQLYAMPSSRDVIGDCIYIDEAWYCRDDAKKAYLTALALELAGEREKAADAYLSVWLNYLDSTFALMAQAKLEPVP